MKKSITLIALAFGITSAFAQDLTSKKGEPILPEAKDWGLGIDATPLLLYAGNFFGKTVSNTPPTWNYNNSTYLQITGKMFKDAQTAYRASIRLGFGGAGTVRKNVNPLPAAAGTSVTGYPAQPTQVENSWTNSATNVGFSVGYEKRRGKTRLQGIYGAELGFSFSGGGDQFKYANALTANATASLQVDVSPADAFAGATNTISSLASGIPGINGAGARMISYAQGLTFAFGLRAFIGAEYFFMPKMSLGGEFGWGVAFSSTGPSTTVWESIGNGTAPATPPDAVGTTTIKGVASSQFILDNNNNNSIWGPSGALKLNFHF